jgi:hypothetical protein
LEEDEEADEEDLALLMPLVALESCCIADRREKEVIDEEKSSR